MYIDVKDVEREAEGKWGYILAHLAPALADAIAADAKKHCACPVHGGTDGFKFFKDYEFTGGGICNSCGSHKKGINLLMWVNDWNFKTALDAIADVLGMEGNSSYEAPAIVPRVISAKASDDNKKENERKTESIKRIWGECIHFMDDRAEPLRLYMVRRGLEYDILPETTVKFHPSLPYYDGDGNMLGKHPAMVAVVYDKHGKPCTLHRTYLTNDGHKAAVPDAKKIMSYASDKSMTGGAIWLEKLEKTSKTIAVAEGIETAIAVKLGTKASRNFPVWSVLNATMLERFEPPEGVDEVLVFADKDRPVTKPGGDVVHPGQDAAISLINRLREKGIKAVGYVPPIKIPDTQKSVDWADMYKWYGDSAFKTGGGAKYELQAA